MAEDKQQIAFNTNFNPQIIREIVRRHWFLPIIYIFLFSTIAFFYLRYTKPMYRSSAKIQIIEEDKVSDVLGEREKNVIKDNQILNKELELLKSDVLFALTEKSSIACDLICEPVILLCLKSIRV